MIKAIIFDLWDTIGTKGFAISKELRNHFKIKEYTDFLFDYENSIQTNQWNSMEEMAKNFLYTFNLPINENNIVYIIKVFNKGIKNAKLYLGIKKILGNLKNKYKVGLISNTTIFEISFIDKFGIRKYFDAVVCSHDIGKLKPSKEIFNEILLKLGVKPEEAIFIDDSEYNINKAVSYGLKGLHFRSASQ